MANFGEIYQSDKFKDLDPGDQAAVRDRFFETRVAPAAKDSGYSTESVSSAFKKKYPISQNIKKRIKGAVGDAMGTMSEKIDSVVNDVDRDTGINHIAFRGDLSSMTGTKEKVNFLNTIVGKDNWVLGNRGEDDFAISTQAGLDRLGMGHLSKGQKKFKPIAIDESGISLSDFFGDTRGAAMPALGAITAGALTGGLGFIPAMAAVGLGGAAGKGIDELRQSVQDKGQFQLQSWKDEIPKDIATEGILAMAGEGVGRALRPLGRALLGPNRRRAFTAFGKQKQAKSVVEPSRRHAVKQALEHNIALPITQATGRNKLLGFFQRMSDTVFGDPRAAHNATELIKWGKQITGKSIGTNISQQKFGEGLAGKFAKQAAKLNHERQALAGAARKKLMVAKNMLRGGKNIKTDTELGESIRNTVASAHDDFMEASSMLYAEPLTKVGGGVNAKIFSSEAIKKVARNKMAHALKTTEGQQFTTATNQVQSKLAQFADLEDTVSFNQLTSLRKDLGKAAYTGNIHSDVASHDAMDFLRAVDDTIDNFAVAPRDAKTGQMVTGKWRDVVEGFRNANKQYSQGIKPFKDVLVKSITKDLTMHGSVQPSMVVNAMKGGAKENVGQLMSIIEKKNPALAQQVKAQFFDDVIWNKTVLGKQIKPNQLVENISKLKPGVLERMYGKEAKTIKQLAHNLDEFGHGTLQVDDAIEQGGVTEVLGKLLQKTQAEEAFLKSNFASIAKQGANIGGSKYGEIVDLAMKDAGYAKELLAMSSPQQIKQAQNIMMQKLINRMVDDSSQITTVLNGKSLGVELSKLGAFSAKEGDNALKIFLGPQKLKELSNLAKVASLTLTEGNSGLVAMSIALNPFSNLGRLAEMTVLGRLLMRPGVINWFVKGSKSKAWRYGYDTATREATQFLAAEIQQITSDASFQEEMEQLSKQMDEQ